MSKTQALVLCLKKRDKEIKPKLSRPRAPKGRWVRSHRHQGAEQARVRGELERRGVKARLKSIIYALLRRFSWRQIRRFMHFTRLQEYMPCSLRGDQRMGHEAPKSEARRRSFGLAPTRCRSTLGLSWLDRKRLKKKTNAAWPLGDRLRAFVNWSIDRSIVPRESDLAVTAPATSRVRKGWCLTMFSTRRGLGRSTGFDKKSEYGRSRFSWSLLKGVGEHTRLQTNI